MYIQRKISLTILLLVVSFQIFSMNYDLTKSITKKYIITEKKDKIILKSEINESFIYGSERSLEISTFIVNEKYYAPISRIKGTYGSDDYYSKNISSSNLSWEYADDVDAFVSEYKTHHIYIPKKSRKVNSFVSYNYKESYDDISFMPFHAITTIDSLDYYQIEFEYPDNFRVEFEVIFPGDSVSYIQQHDVGISNISFFELPYKEDISYSQNLGYAIVLCMIYKDGELLTPNTPGKMMDWFGRDVFESAKLDSSWNNILKEEIESGENDWEKLKIINNYVKTNVRYIAFQDSIHSFVPHNPNRVLTSMFGDCKDKAFLVHTIAKKYGINVQLALVNSDPIQRQKSTHFAFYNHMICVWDNGEGMMFFDPTAKYCDFGNLPKHDARQYAMILDPENPRYEYVPITNDLPDFDLTVNADLDSLNRSEATITLHNDLYSYACYAKNELTGIELENYISNLLTSYFYKISLDYITFDKLEDNSIIMKAKADLSEFIIDSNNSKKKYVTKTPFIVFDRSLLKRKEDMLPLFFSDTYEGRLTINLKAPEYGITNPEHRLDYQAGTCFMANGNKVNEGSLGFVYQFKMGITFIENSQKEEFLGFVKKYFKAKKKMFILEEGV